MKILCLIFTIFLTNCMAVCAQTVTNGSIDTIVQNANKPVIAAVNKLPKNFSDSLRSVLKSNPVPIKITQGTSTVIVFLPVFLFLLIFLIVLKKLRKENVRLSDFLIDKDIKVAIKKEETSVAKANSTAAIAIANATTANAPAYLAAKETPPVIETPQTVPAVIPDADPKEQSTSRFIAFVSGITSVALAACITAFYFYKSFLGYEDVSIGNLANVLYGLGLGLLPYGFNKVAGALKGT